MKFFKALPEFSAELREALKASGRDDLAGQVFEIEIEGYPFDASCNAAVVYVRSPRELNVIEKNIIGVKHGQTVSVDHPYGLNIDIDNFGRLSGIEVLTGNEIAEKLAAVGAPQQIAGEGRS